MTIRFLLVIFLFSLLPSFGWSLCVKKSVANLRAAPSTKAPLVWTVGRYMPFVKVGQDGKWIKVKDVDGRLMWIYKSLVTSSIDCAVVRTTASLRVAPGKANGKTPLARAHKYMPFKKIKREGAWLRVEDFRGGRHWIYESNVWEPTNTTKLSY